MAQSRSKRRRKHRGTQAGTIERAGRTSKPPPDQPRKVASSSRANTRSDAKSIQRQRREERLDREPTWRGSVNRAAFAAVILVVFVAATQKNVAQAVVLGAFAMLIYIPMGYYTDRALYRRRQRRKQAGGR